MTTLFTVSTLLSLLAIALLVGCIRQTRRGRLFKASSSFAGGLSTAALGGAGLLLGVSYLGYERLAGETVIGQIEFIATASDEYSVRLMRNQASDRFFELNGDEWQIDARVISWTPPATILGLEPVYELERISGRYADIERERSEARTVFSLSDNAGVDLWSLARRFPALTPGIDAYYGTATYLPMADGARYEISLTRNALIARPVNEQARTAVGNWRRD